VARPKKVSQTQIAIDLGVSQALVSLVLNGRKDGISPETYERIWQHAAKRGYRPKGMHFSSSPAANDPHQVGFILRAPLRLSAPGNYFSHIQHGLHTALEKEHFSTVFLGSEDEIDPVKLRRIFSPGHLFRGVALLGEVARPFLLSLKKTERRIVAISARYPGLCHSVLGNEPLALEMLVRHLYDFGHRRIGWLGGNVGLGRHEARLNAFQTALKAAGLTPDPRYHAGLQQADRAEGANAIHSLLPLARRKDFPTAFVCYNCLMAAGATAALQREGWKVPADLSIAGADTPPPPSAGTPEVSGAGADPRALGEAAARLILTATGSDDESFHDLTLPAQFIPGSTTGPAPQR
jgi:LacI family transcriptional regulator